ncbi:OstA-like protein [Blattabacterium cuenoti]|uniref:OstA-like protein n=1 Tax=Blattabacterium cuenoti TaxID=1653831 RepID=UPI00163BAF99
MKYVFIIFFIFETFSFSFSNERKTPVKIQIIHSDIIQNYDHNSNFFLIGNVHLKYKKYHLFCDKITYNKKNNKFHGYGNVRLESEKNKIISKNIVGDFFNFQLSGNVILYQGKIKLKSKIINYNFDKKLLQAVDNVVLFFDKIKLTTNLLEYNFRLHCISYKKKSMIHYGDYIICSKEGFFYIKKNKIELKHKIKLISKNYTAYANTLEYLLNKNQINFNNTVVIMQNTNFNNFLYAKKALFLFQKKIFLFEKYVSIHYNDQIIKGKYLFFDQKKKYGFIRNILLEDFKKKYFLISGYGKFDFHSGFLILKENPIIIKKLNNNSVFIYSSILKINIHKNYTYSIQSFSMKIFFESINIKGKCDFFNYESSNDYIKLNGNPIFFFGKNKQITGKNICVHLKNDFIKYIKIVKNAFYIEKINSKEFNQIEGDMMTIFFDTTNVLEKIMFQGNIHGIIFIKYDKEIKMINRLRCDILSIYLDKLKKIRKISCAKETCSELIPINKETPNKIFYLPKFSWKEKYKPKNDKKSFVDQEIDKYRKENFLEKKEIKAMIR